MKMKDRTVPNYRTAIDYHALPEEALIPSSEVSLLTCMSPAVLDRRIEAGEFPRPVRHGYKRLWPYGQVKEWLRLQAEMAE